MEPKPWGIPFSEANSAAFPLAVSAIAMTGKPALAYAGRWAARTMPPAPRITIGRGVFGRGGRGCFDGLPVTLFVAFSSDSHWLVCTALSLYNWDIQVTILREDFMQSASEKLGSFDSTDATPLLPEAPAELALPLPLSLPLRGAKVHIIDVNLESANQAVGNECRRVWWDSLRPRLRRCGSG